MVDGFEPEIRRLLAEFPDMPATVIAERIGWVHSSSVLRGRVAQLRPLFRPADPADRTTYVAGEIVECDLWFPGKVVPVGKSMMDPPVLTMVASRRPKPRSPSSTSFWDGVQQKLDLERIRKGLASLTTIQREVLTLAYFGGYTQSQVASMLKLPMGTVKTRIRPGLIVLRYDALGVKPGFTDHEPARRVRDSNPRKIVSDQEKLPSDGHESAHWRS